MSYCLAECSVIFPLQLGEVILKQNTGACVGFVEDRIMHDEHKRRKKPEVICKKANFLYVEQEPNVLL